MRARLTIFLLCILCSASALTQNYDCWITFNENSLLRFNSKSCTVVTPGYTSANLTDIAVTPSGQLYGCSFDNLYRIDTTTLYSTFIAQITPGLLTDGFNALMAVSDTLLLGVKTTGTVYRISTAGDTTQIGSIGYPSAGDITYYRGHYYALTFGTPDHPSQLIRMDFNDDFSAITYLESMGDVITPYSSPFGILTVGTATCEYDDLKMLVFEVDQIFEINPETAECTLMCSGYYSAGAYGAASRSETHFQEYEGMLEIPNVFTPYGDGINDHFQLVWHDRVQAAEIVILNRWGNLVYESDELDFRWDGRSENDAEIHPGVYFYKLTATDMCGRKQEYQGYITLVRD